VNWHLQRRDFVTLLGGAVAAWPLAARAQQPRRVGVLMADAATSPTGQIQVATLVQGLRKLGWIDGQTLQIEVRWTAADPTLIRANRNGLGRPLQGGQVRGGVGQHHVGFE
jgi:putative ABC transport system substrate-binding protein